MEMTAEDFVQVPVWTLATQDVSVPDVLNGEVMTQARLAELRTVLASLADSPIATLEAYPVTFSDQREGGISLHAASPLAQQLSLLVKQTVQNAPAKMESIASGEVLYRMVVPAKVAAQVGEGLVKPMASNAAVGGIYSALRDSSGIVAKATFVPVAGKAAVTGAATGSAATAGVAVASAGVLTVAAPLVLMAVAVGVSAYADNQRQHAIERVTELLEQLHEIELMRERNDLDACRETIDDATSILLDEGKLGLSLGLDTASHKINTAMSAALTRINKWKDSLDSLAEGPVNVEALAKLFPGVTEDGGEFRAHLELARLAIALKRRVLVLQAVEHSQQDPGNQFRSFTKKLQANKRRVDVMEAEISSVLLRLSSLELKPRGGLRNQVFTQGKVDGLLKSVYRLHALGEGLGHASPRADVAIDIKRSLDGSLVVFPAVSV